MSRTLTVLLALVLTSCATDRATEAQREPCCTEPEGAPANAAEACAAKGCSYGPALSCGGTQLPPEEEALEREDRETCRMQCACTCPEDVEACANVP